MKYPRIEQRREALGLTRRRLGKLAGVSEKRLLSWAKYGDIPPWALRRLSEVLGCSAEYLLGRCDELNTACVQ